LNRKLVVLNVALVGAVVYTGGELRQHWVAAKEREVEIIKRGKVPTVPTPPFTPLKEVPAVLPSGYAKIAENDLLDPSRNPDLPVEQPPPPPPPPVMPALPCYHGMMNIGDGPEIIMGVNCGAAHKRLHSGDPIGEFKLVAFNSQAIELEWNGQQIIKSVAELAAREGGPPAAEASSQADAAAPTTRVQLAPAAVGPDQNTNASGERACQDNDTTPAGTVVDGVVKTIIKNGITGRENCIWRPVAK
jgi:hypothetical protein